MSDFKDTKKKVEQSEIDWAEFLSDASETLLNTDNPILREEQRRLAPTKYKCTLAKFSTFIEAKNGEKNSIVRSRKSTGGGTAWYHYAKGFIKTSLSSNSFDAIYSGISQLKNREPDPTIRFDDINIQYSREVLENYLDIKFPLEFKQLRKILFSPKETSLQYSNIELSTFGLQFFRGKYNGQNIVGCTLISCVFPEMTRIQMEVATFLIQKFIEEKVLEDGEVCLPEFCICIDARRNRYYSASNISNIGKVRITISKEAQDFCDRWEQIFK